MPEPDDLFKRQQSQVQAASDVFNTKRKYRDSIIFREATPDLDESLKKWAPGIDIESPDLEWALAEHVAIQTLNPPRVDVVPLQKTHKDKIEHIRIWDAASLKKQDIDTLVAVVAHDQWRYGRCVIRKYAHGLDEPGEEAYEGVADTERNEKRKAYYMDGEDADCFSWKRISPFEFSHFPPVEDFEVCFQDSVIPYVEARELSGDGDTKFRYDKSGNGMIVGQGWSDEDELPQSQWEGKTVHFVVREMRDPETGVWKCTEWVRHGEDKTEQLREYPVPFSRSSFHVIPSGQSFLTETVDPDRRYRPGMLPLIVNVDEMNQMQTKLMALAEKYSGLQNRVIELPPNLDPAVIGFLGDYGLIDGSGAQQRLLIPDVMPGSDDVQLIPGKFQQLAGNVGEAMVLSIQLKQEQAARYMPNRYLTGNVDDTSQTGTAFTLQTQHASVPYERNLIFVKRFLEEFLDSEHKAICYWDEKAPRPYKVTASTGMPVEAKYEPGDTIAIDADDLQMNFEIVVTMRNETLAEEQANQAMAYANYDHRTMKKSQLLKSLGYEDPERQQEELDEEDAYEEYRMRFKGVRMAQIDTAVEALTGLSAEMIAAMNMTTTEGASGGVPQDVGSATPLPGNNAPSVRLNPGTQGVPTT